MSDNNKDADALPLQTNNTSETHKHLQEQDINDTPDIDFDIDDYNVDSNSYALFCLEYVPPEYIDDILEQTATRCGHYSFWLPGDYSTLPETPQEYAARPPLPQDYRSPFVGATIEQAFDHVRRAPGDKVSKKHIVVLEKKLFEEKRWVKIYRMEGKDLDEVVRGKRPGNITELPGDAYKTWNY